MPNAAIFWEPDRGPMRSLSLGGLSTWDPIPVHARADVATYGGRVVRQHLSSGARWRIGIEAFAPGQRERELQSLATHIGRGLPFGIARDDSKAWCGYLMRTPAQGDTEIRTGGQVWHGDGDSTLADGDDLVIESLDGTFKSEVVVCGEAVTHDEKNVTIDAPGVLYDHSGVGWLRHRYYLPNVHVPADALGAPFLTSRNRRIFTLDLTVELSPASVASLFATDGAPWSLGELPGGLAQTAAGSRRSITEQIERQTRDPVALGGP